MNVETTHLEYHDKIARYQNAIHNCVELTGFLSSDTQDGNNDPDDRYWSSIFHKVIPDPSYNKETQLGYGLGATLSSIVFVYDHRLNKSLCVKISCDPADESDYRNRAHFAQCFDHNNTLIMQFRGALLLYKLSPKTMAIQKIIDSREGSKDYEKYFSRIHLKRVVFEKTGLSYIASITNDGSLYLAKFNWETLSVEMTSLSGYMTNYGGLYSVFVKEIDGHPIVVLGIRGKQKSDPDMGYALFIKNGPGEDGLNLWNFKNEFFQQWTPTHFTFSRLQKNGYIQINVFRDKFLLTKTIVPTNMKLLDTPSSTVPLSVLAR